MDPSAHNGILSGLEHIDQNLNQENICFRSDICRQSDVGQNTNGNDNQVTGFADQSDNIQQQSASAIPDRAHVLVHKIVDCPGGVTCPQLFRINVVGNSPNPSQFAIRNHDTVQVDIGRGSYQVTESLLQPTPPNLVLNTIYGPDCSGIIESAGTHKFCQIINEYILRPAT